MARPDCSSCLQPTDEENVENLSSNVIESVQPPTNEVEVHELPEQTHTTIASLNQPNPVIHVLTQPVHVWSLSHIIFICTLTTTAANVPRKSLKAFCETLSLNGM